MKKRLLASFLAVVMVVTLLPISALATGGTPATMKGTADDPITNTNNGVTVNKYVSGNETDGYKLTLEAYASDELTTTTTTTPLDIVLVLDVSGSMDEILTDEHTEYRPVYEINTSNYYFIESGRWFRTVHYTEAYTTWEWDWDEFGFVEVHHDAGWIYGSESDPQYVVPMTSAEDTEEGHTQFYTAVSMQRVTKIEALKNAVNSFIDQVNTKNNGVAAESQHRISVVKFADDSYYQGHYDSIGDNQDHNDYNYTQVVKDFTSDASGLKTAVNALNEGGATAADYGLELAEHVLNGDGSLTGARDNAKKVIVFFTDGEPNHSNGFSGSVAAAAVNTAKDLKAAGVRLYTVGVFEEETANILQYMNGVSSNYPDASAEYGWHYFRYGDKNTDGVQYYALADDADELNSIFAGIADSVTTGTLEANPDATSVLSDTLSQYVNFPNGLTGSSEAIKVQYAPAESYTVDSDGNKIFTFGEAGVLPEGVSRPTVEINGDTITIEGFDYKANAASYNKTDGKVSGGKLVVTFPIVIDETACNEDTTITNGYYPTNSQAGLSYKGTAASTTNDASTTLTDSPKVPYTKPDFTVTWMSQDGSTPLETDKNVTYGTMPSYDGDEPTKDSDGRFTYTFAGWATEPNQETGTAVEDLPKVTESEIYYAAFSKTEITRYDITINYQDNQGTTLKDPYTDNQAAGYEYTFDVSDNTDGTIPFIIEKTVTVGEEQKPVQYVFDHFTADSDGLSGTLESDIDITAVYLLDSDKDGTPDQYEATVTYKVANGTWSDETTTDKTANFILEEFDDLTNTWKPVTPTPTLGSPTSGAAFPTGMKPDDNHIADGASWNAEINAQTTVTEDVTYTYTFNTSANSALTVDKTLVSVNGSAYVTGSKVEVGDELTYTIKVTNDGNVPLSGVTVTDTFTGSGAPTATTGGVTWNLNTETGKYEATWEVGTLARNGQEGYEQTLTYTYTVPTADKGKTITNSAVATSGSTEGEDKIEVTVYNPAMTVDKELTQVNGTAVTSGETVLVQKDDVLTYTITVENTGDQDLSNVEVTDELWTADTALTVSGVEGSVTPTGGCYTIASLAEDDTVTITYTYTVTAADATAGTVVNSAQVTDDKAPEDEDKTTTTVIGDIVVTPADITVYTGGDGYTGAVNGTTGLGETSGLPEPGFYVDLPAALDAALKEAAQKSGSYDGSGPLDLSGHLVLTAKDSSGTTRTWTLEKYDRDNAIPVTINDQQRYIYRLVHEEGQPAVRMQFKDGDQVISSDDFTIKLNTLYEEYEMSIYAGSMDTATVEAQITFDSTAAYTYTASAESGMLTVRGVVNNGESTTQIATEIPSTGNQIIAVAQEGTSYLVNGSNQAVNDSTGVELLVDSVVETGKTELKDYVLENLDTVESLQGLTGVDSNSVFKFQYLDLVDASNGNVWIKPSQAMTIYWPYPEDADTSGTFYVIHFDGLDRNYTNLENALASNPPEVLEATKVAGGITFTVSSFSPFALVYNSDTVTLSYNANGGSGTAPADQTVNKGTSVTVASNPFTNSGYTFAGWNTKADGTGTYYAENATIVLNSDVTLYAQWDDAGGGTVIERYYTLHYESNGGTKYEDERYPEGHPVTLDKVPLREGYTFTGWYADEALTEPINRIVMNSDKTVYAGWRKTTVPDGLNGDDHFAYVIGYDDGTVKPMANIARSEVAAIFFRLLDPEIREEYLTDANPFTDVNPDDWYSKAVSTLYQLDIFKGRTATTFAPDAPITRAEFAAICARFDTGVYDGQATFNDIAGHWAEKEIKRAASLGWIMGAPDGNFYPNQLITRAEAMTMINRVLNRIPEDESDLLNGMNVWPDNPTSAWYYLAVQEATNTHDYVTKGEIYETWTKLLEDPDWTQYQ